MSSKVIAFVIGEDQRGASWMEDGGMIVTGGFPTYLTREQVEAVRKRLARRPAPVEEEADNERDS